MDERVKGLIIGYFGQDIANCNFTEKTKKYIIEQFTFFVENDITLKELRIKNKGRGLSKWVNIKKLNLIRQQISKTDKCSMPNFKPFPIRLGELKPQLQREACGRGISTSALVLMILEERKALRNIYSES